VSVEKIRVLVADDHPFFRDGLRTLLESAPDTEFVGEAETGGQAVSMAEDLQPDVILMDVQMPDIDGLETTRRIRAQERAHRATIVALTANALASDEARCLAAGMDGYLQKPLSIDRLSSAIREVAPRA
jgi:CheY-like chemotaxis protein